MFIVPKYNDDIEGFAQIKEKSVAKQKNGNNFNCRVSQGWTDVALQFLKISTSVALVSYRRVSYKKNECTHTWL